MATYVAPVDQDEETLDELEQWLAWFADQPGAERTPYWLDAFRRQRQRMRAMRCAQERRLRQFVDELA